MPSAHRFRESLTETPKIPERSLGIILQTFSLHYFSIVLPKDRPSIFNFRLLAIRATTFFGKAKVSPKGRCQDPPSRMKRMKQIEYRMQIEYKIEQIEYVY